MGKRLPYDPQREDLYVAKDDVMGPGAHDDQVVTGYSSTMRFTKTALGHPLIRYKDHVIEADVYPSPDGQGFIAHLICPKCTNNLQVDSNKKQVGYDPETDTISIEKISCTWEADGSIRKDFGFNRCGWKVVIDNNIAKDA